MGLSPEIESHVNTLLRLAAASGLAGLALATPALADSLPGPATATGDYLAGQQAITELRTHDAAQFFHDAAALDPQNPLILDRAFVAYATDGDLSPDRRLRENSARDFALYVPTASQVAGDVAKQLIRSPPGRYRIEALVGDVPDDPARQPLIRVSCADQGEHILGSADFPAAPAGGRRMVLDFTVPAGCADQWVAIRVKGTLDQAERGWAWISALSMRRS